jgi:peptidoglycan/LPS O-acetylase OafA/YrhL
MPAFYVAIAFTIIAKYLLNLPINFPHAFSMATYWGNYFNAFHGHPPTGFDLYWSISLEEQFYLIWPLLFTLFYKNGPTSLLKFLVVSILGVCGWRSIAYLYLSYPDAYVYNAFDTRFDSLAIGCVLGILVNNVKSDKIIHQLTRHSYFPILTLLAIMSLNHVNAGFHYSIGLTIQALLMGIFILQLVALSEHSLWSWLNSKVMIFLGSLSYSIYLYHSWGLALGHKFHFLPKIMVVILGAVVTTIMAYCSYRLIEKPFIDLRKRIEKAGKLSFSTK